MSETVKQPTVARSPLSKPPRYYYFTRYKPVGRGIKVVGQKTDVTDSVRHLVEQEVLSFLDYVQDTYGLALWDPAPKEGEDGKKYIHGVKEATGYEYLNELVAEWRQRA